MQFCTIFVSKKTKNCSGREGGNFCFLIKLNLWQSYYTIGIHSKVTFQVVFTDDDDVDDYDNSRCWVVSAESLKFASTASTRSKTFGLLGTFFTKIYAILSHFTICCKSRTFKSGKTYSCNPFYWQALVNCLVNTHLYYINYYPD